MSKNSTSNKKKNVGNIAFIDGQNLHLGVAEEGWSFDYTKLRVYLRDKYNVQEAYYLFGYIMNNNTGLYNQLQRSGYIVQFKDYEVSAEQILSKKKGNVDVDLVFFVMHTLIERDDFDKIVLVSGDGDYFRLVKYLIEKKRLSKILFPNKRSRSSLYKEIGNKHVVYLDNIKHKIQYLKKKRVAKRH